MTLRQIRLLRNALLSVCLLAGLGACAMTKSPVAMTSPLSDEQALEQFESGEANMSCGTGCADAWQRDQPELASFYQSQAWQSLAVRVLQINYRQDLGYFYLGRAAEGLRRRSAALTYYHTAVDLASGTDPSAKCSASTAGCNGVRLLAEAMSRIQAVTAQRTAAAPARRVAARARASTAGPWVDPTPVSSP